MRIRIKSGGSIGRVAGGCFTALFGLPFFAIGMFFFVMGIGGLVFPGWIEGDTIAQVMAVIMGGIFAMVGGGIIVGSLLKLGPGSSRPGGKLMAIPKGPNPWPAFPKARTRGRGPSGGQLLKAEVTRGMALVGILIGAVLWNGISWFAMWAVVYGDKNNPMFVKILIGLFCVIGLVIIGMFVRQLLIMLSWKGTQVEVGKELLRAGESTPIRIYQRGDFAIDRLKLIVCAKETAKYRVGTKTRTSTEDIWSKVIVEQQDLRAQSGRPIVQAEINIPPEAMHSFEGTNNQLQWVIRMEVDAPNRIDIKEAYSFRVAAEVTR